METTGLMAGGVAHDLNNILSGVVSYPKLLMLQIPDDSAIYKSLQIIKESGQRAAAVVADLLTVARGSAMARSVTDLNRLIREFLASPEWLRVRSVLGSDGACKRDRAGELFHIPCSPTHSRKCLMNLLLNAAEASGA